MNWHLNKILLSSFNTLSNRCGYFVSLAKTKTDWNDRPRKTQRMKSVTVDTFGVAYPEPEKC